MIINSVDKKLKQLVLNVKNNYEIIGKHKLVLMRVKIIIKKLGEEAFTTLKI